MKTKLNTILYFFVISSTVAAVTISICFNIYKGDTFNCEEIVVVGCDYLTTEIIIEKQLEHLEGNSIFNINKRKVQELLTENQFVSDAKISILMPNTIIIELTEIIPISKIKLNNIVHIIDNNKNSFACSKSAVSSIPNIPILYHQKNIKSNLISSLDQFELVFDAYEKYEGIYDEIKYVKSKGEFLEAKINNSIIYFNDNYKKQLFYLDRFIATLNQNDIQFDFKYIKFAGQNIVVGDKNSL